MRNMTEGSISRHLLSYAVPMILGNILQLTYNAVDSMVVSKALGENALAAVSTANPIMTIVILGVSGLSLGGSVIMSRYYGAGDIENMKKEFSTTFIFSLVLSIIVFVLGFTFSEQILYLVNTPAEIIQTADVYLKIVFVGFLFTFQYNVISAAMRSVGDAKTPVVFLSLSCAVNIFLDIVFVCFLKAGVAGAGAATATAEGISVLCCIIYIYRKMPLLRLKKKEIVFEKKLLCETLQIGSLTALQQSAQPIGKILIQSVINAQGVIAMGAFNAVCRIDDFACIPSQSIGSSIMTCTAQNRGAKNRNRVRDTFKYGIKTALIYFPVIWVFAMLFKSPAIKILTPDNSYEMIAMGISYMSIKAWFFIFPCINNAIQGFFRGMSKMNIVLFATVLQISIRTVGVYFLVPIIGISGEAYSCMIGWSCQLIFEFGYYFIIRNRMYKSI